MDTKASNNNKSVFAVFKLSLFLQVGLPRHLFNLFSFFQTQITIFTTNKSEKNSIQYTVLGFKLTTFGNESLPITTRPGLPSSIKFIYPSYKECKDNFLGAVVVAQLVEWLLPIPKVHGSNPAIGKNLFISIEHLFTINCVLERRK